MSGGDTYRLSQGWLRYNEDQDENPDDETGMKGSSFSSQLHCHL